MLKLCYLYEKENDINHIPRAFTGHIINPVGKKSGSYINYLHTSISYSGLIHYGYSYLNYLIISANTHLQDVEK